MAKQKEKSIDWLAAFKEYVLEEGYPKSIHTFCKVSKIKEGDFYDQAGSFTRLEKSFWLDQFEKTLKTLHGDKVYATYTTREKVLAFFFTFFENLKDERSFILICQAEHKHFDMYKTIFKGLQKPFEAFVDNMIAEGMASEEIVSRSYLDKAYAKGFWLEFMFVLKFWLMDDSPGFEETDAAVEKSVNLAFDLLGKGPLDAMLDFGKFMIKSMR